MGMNLIHALNFSNIIWITFLRDLSLKRYSKSIDNNFVSLSPIVLKTQFAENSWYFVPVSHLAVIWTQTANYILHPNICALPLVSSSSLFNLKNIFKMCISGRIWTGKVKAFMMIVTYNVLTIPSNHAWLFKSFHIAKMISREFVWEQIHTAVHNLWPDPAQEQNLCPQGAQVMDLTTRPLSWESLSCIPGTKPYITTDENNTDTTLSCPPVLWESEISW